MQIRLEDGMTIDEAAIKLIQAYEPSNGYYLGFSGGKDSVVIEHLAHLAGVKYTPVYNVSPIDPPQIHWFIKEYYPQVVWENHAQGFWTKHFMIHGLPLRQTRWCCRIIKEAGGVGRVKILGMRKAESKNHGGRSKYSCFTEREDCSQLLPILNWSDADVWQYISEHNLPFCSLYRHGFQRIGCVLCPFQSKDDTKISIQLFPKIVGCWKRACDHYIEQEQQKTKRRKPVTFKNGEEYFNWWINR